MALIQRPVKQFGFRTYDADFNAAPLNPTPPPTHLYEIQTQEVDGDLDTIYALVNGALDSTNLSPTASILGSQLAIGAAVNGAVTGTTTVFAEAGTTEQTILALPALTCRGGRVVLALSPSGNADWSVASSVVTPAVAGKLSIRLKRDGATIQTWHASYGSGGLGITVAGDPTAFLTISTTQPIPSYVFSEVPIAGAHVYTWTIQQTVLAGGGISFGDDGSGHGFAIELS